MRDGRNPLPWDNGYYNETLSDRIPLGLAKELAATQQDYVHYPGFFEESTAPRLTGTDFLRIERITVNGGREPR